MQRRRAGHRLADPPVERPNRFYLTINLKTAEALGITFPRAILLLAGLLLARHVSARAVRMAVAMQRDVGSLVEAWRKRGIKLGFGVGISSGYATLGHIGSEDQFHYTAIGSVVNLASRLCDEAKSGQILITESVYAEVEEIAEVKHIGDLALKGIPRPVPILRVVSLREGAAKS